MNKTKIEYADFTWNPIKGICPVGCWYCFAGKMYKRFKWNPEVRLDLDELMADFPKKPSRIFACSTFDLFHPLADPYRNNVFKHIGLLPEHTFIILTKMPEKIDRPMPDNVWLGVSVTKRDEQWRINKLCETTSLKRLISFEPLLEDDVTVPNGLLSGVDWVIVGRLTGHGQKYNPTRVAVENVIKAARLWNVPVFLKNNLREIWGPNLIQELSK